MNLGKAKKILPNIEKFIDENGVTNIGDFVELYHGTSARRANKIAKEGFRIKAVKNQTMGGDPVSSRDYIWFAKKDGSAKSYSEMHGNPKVLTVRMPREVYEKINNHGLNSGPDSVWSKQEIPAEYIYNPKVLKGATAIAAGSTMLPKDALAAKYKQMEKDQALEDAYSPVDMVIAGATGGATMGLRAISALADPVINYAIDRMLGD